jgi:hypothetical protein
VYAEALIQILSELGKPAIRIAYPDPNDSSLHIILCAQTVEPKSMPKNYVLWQFEQVHSFHWTPAYLSMISNALAVWDYCEANFVRYESLNQNRYFVPPYWHKSLSSNKTHTTRDIPVLFYGSMNDTRQKTLDELGKSVNVKVITNSTKSELSDLLTRAKVVVNLHYYDNALLETPRVCQALANGCRVISEKSINETDLDQYIDQVDLASSSQIIEALNKPAKPLPAFAELPKLQLATYVKIAMEKMGLLKPSVKSNIIQKESTENKKSVLVTSASFGSNFSSTWVQQRASNSYDITYNRINDATQSPRQNAMHPRLRGKIPKMLQWQASPNYDYYVWIDSSFSIIKDDAIEWLIQQCSDFDMCVFKHSDRKTIRDELSFMQTAMVKGSQYLKSRYDGELMQEQVLSYLEDSSFIDCNLFECGIFIYKKSLVNDVDHNVLKEWFHQNCIWSVQDQLSLPYMFHKFKTKYTTFDCNIFSTKHFRYN